MQRNSRGSRENAKNILSGSLVEIRRHETNIFTNVQSYNAVHSQTMNCDEIVLTILCSSFHHHSLGSCRGSKVIASCYSVSTIGSRHPASHLTSIAQLVDPQKLAPYLVLHILLPRSCWSLLCFFGFSLCFLVLISPVFGVFLNVQNNLIFAFL